MERVECRCARQDECGEVRWSGRGTFENFGRAWPFRRERGDRATLVNDSERLDLHPSYLEVTL